MRWRHSKSWVVSSRAQALGQFWEGAREVLKCRLACCWLGAVSQNHGPCPQAWILWGFHPINLEQSHWTLCSAFHFQIDNWVNCSLVQWALAQSSKTILRGPLAMIWEMELALVTLSLSASCSWASFWERFIQVLAQVMEWCLRRFGC